MKLTIGGNNTVMVSPPLAGDKPGANISQKFLQKAGGGGGAAGGTKQPVVIEEKKPISSLPDVTTVMVPPVSIHPAAVSKPASASVLNTETKPEIGMYLGNLSKT